MAPALLGLASSAAQAQPAPSPIAPAPQQSAQSPAGTVPVRVVEQPLSVRVVEAAKADVQSNDQLVVFTAILVALGTFLVIAFAVLAFYLGAGFRTMRQSSEAAERSLVATHRAFVYVSDLAWSTAGANVRISPVWTNSGTTPTRRLRVATNWKASHGELRPEFDINYAQPPESLFLGPASNVEFGSVLVPMRDIRAAIEERLHIYIWGRATYEDMFDGKRPHYFEFCHRLEVEDEAPGNIKIRFVQFGLSNGSDEDSQKPAEATS